MAISVVDRFASGRLQDGLGGLTVTFSIGTISVGDKISFGVGELQRDAVTATDGLGNTYTRVVDYDDATYGRGQLYECDVSSGGSCTITLTFTTSFNILWMAGVRATGVGTLNDSDGQHTTYGTSQSGASVAVGTDDSLVVAFFCGSSYPNSNDAGTASGYTQTNCADGGAGARDQAIQALDAIKDIADSPVAPEIIFGGPQYGVVVAAAFSPGGAPSLPDLTWQGRYPDLFPAQRLLMRREMQAFSGIGKPERKLAYFDAPQPAAVRHPEYDRRHSYFAYAFVDRQSPHVAVTAPDRLARPALPVASQMASAPRGVVERPVAFAEALVPPRLVRPAMPVALQQDSAPRGWPFEPPAPEPSVTAPTSARRASAVAVQQAYADPTYQWGLAPPAPDLSWRGTWPDSLRRPALLPAEQQALAFWPLPDRSLPAAAALMPASVRRSMFLAALQQAYADPTYGWNLVPAAPTLSWRGEQPASTRRPVMPVGEQQAHALPPKPERIAAIAVAIHPDRLIRLFMHASEQQASPRVPLDRNTVLVAVVAPDRVVRAWMPVSEQQAVAGLGVPIVPTPAPDLITAYYPAGALLPPRAPMMSFAAPVSQRGTPASVRIHAVASDVRLTDAATGDTVLSKEKADSE